MQQHTERFDGRWQWFHILPHPTHERRADTFEEERHISPDAARQHGHLGARDRARKSLGQQAKRGCGIAAATRQTGGHRDALGEPGMQRRDASGGLGTKPLDSQQHEVVIHGTARVALDDEFICPLGRTVPVRDGQCVREPDPQEDRT